MAEAVRRALLCGTHTTSSTSAAGAPHTRSGYRDAKSPILALHRSYKPEIQERMLLCQLVTTAFAAPHESGSDGGSIYNGTNNISNSSSACNAIATLAPAASLRGCKEHVLAALDPGPYLQMGDERSVPLDSEFVSPFPPFQWWWKQKKQHHKCPTVSPGIAEERHRLFSSTLRPLFQLQQLQQVADAASPRASVEGTGTPSSSFGQTAVPQGRRGGDRDDSRSNSNRAVPAQESRLAEHTPAEAEAEAEAAAAAEVVALIPQLLASTPLGRTVAKERAKAAMAVALDPFFKND
ncbi:hypothetical protein DQ04_14001010 [Trypanosoma grayi]|uniref:hypothetical protein n=1 Tax=Trypanosoma grayi TaxID=71804 RepID=UPI0004F4A693|nr:hypothetical protein DQ04_14001010 [Trypanosoma grayi]KEG06421.1 hypothetical protein DQ04_14001010 [Trypanosoma grayi]